MPAASPAMSGRGAGDGDLYAQNQAPQRLAAASAGFRTEADLAVSLEMFTCERRTMRLSRPACAKLWASAKRDRPQPWEGRHACLACPVGASNAGVPAERTAAVAEAYRSVCTRCMRRAMRLINRQFCVSCYNRDREALIGRNRKGSRPALCDRLGAVQARVRRPGGPGVVRAERVSGLPEVLISLAKVEADPMSLGRSGVVWWPGQPAQLVMVLDLPRIAA